MKRRLIRHVSRRHVCEKSLSFPSRTTGRHALWVCRCGSRWEIQWPAYEPATWTWVPQVERQS